jgi:D-alanyl-D-alanine dipeptidase
MKNTFDKLRPLILPLITIGVSGCVNPTKLIPPNSVDTTSANKGELNAKSQPFEEFKKNRQNLQLRNRQSISLQKALRSGQFVDITTKGFSADQVRLKYSETNKFGAPIYPKDQKCYLDVDFANKLKEAQNYLDKNHKGVKIIFWDCLRTKTAHDIIKQRVIASGNQSWLGTYVAKGNSIHSFGSAADIGLTLNNNTLDLGSEFDDFSKKAAYRETKNQQLLYNLCAYSGIALNPNEIWHVEGNISNNSRIVK